MAQSIVAMIQWGQAGPKWFVQLFPTTVLEKWKENQSVGLAPVVFCTSIILLSTLTPFVGSLH